MLFRRFYRRSLLRSLAPFLSAQARTDLEHYVGGRSEWQALKGLMPVSFWRRLQREQQLEAARRELVYAVSQALQDMQASPASTKRALAAVRHAGAAAESALLGSAGRLAQFG